MKKPGTWDMGLDYLKTMRQLTRLYRRENKPMRKAYYAILLIQLRNGSRISEAVRAYKQFCKTRKYKLYVNVSKKKKPVKREMVIPAFIDDSICVDKLVGLDSKKLVERVKHFSIYNLGINTHSLRYAFITHLLKHNISPSIIAKITKHSRLDFILKYTEEKAAEEILEML